MSIELKIKSKSLEAEARIIRHSEKKMKGRARYLVDRQKPADKIYSNISLLHVHRVRELRDAARSTFLARAFIANKDMLSVEGGYMDNSNTKDMRIINAAWKIVTRYSIKKHQDHVDFFNWTLGITTVPDES